LIPITFFFSDVRLVFREVGEGRPIILFHDFASTAARTWPAHVEPLTSRGFRVVLPDLRGHGDSERSHDPDDYRPDVLTDDGFTLLRHLGLKADSGDYDLAGVGSGGWVVARMLVRGAKPGRAIVANQDLEAVLRPAAARRAEFFRDVLTSAYAPKPGTPEHRAEERLTAGGGDRIALAHVLDTVVDTRPAELATITTPTLVLSRDGAALAEALGNARHATPPDDDVEHLLPSITDFLDAQPPPPPKAPPGDDDWPRGPWQRPLGAVVEHDGPVVRTHYGTHGTIDHRDLTGVEPADLAYLVERQSRHFLDRGEPVEWKVHLDRAPDLPMHLLAAGFTLGWERSVLVAQNITAPPAGPEVRESWHDVRAELRDPAERSGPHRVPFADLEADGVHGHDKSIQVVVENGRVVGAGWAFDVADTDVVVIGGLTGPHPGVLSRWAEWRPAATFFAEADGVLRDFLLDAGFREVATVRSFHRASPQPPPAQRQVVRLSDDPVHDDLWDRFAARFEFRPGIASFPGITEPPGSVTWSLDVDEAGLDEAGLDELDRVVERGLRRCVRPGERLYWLDWQHAGYRFEPDRVGRPGQPPWPGSAYPDGDYYLYVPRDLRFGTFGHPWEHTLCVFGESLVAHVEEALNKLLGPPVRRS
jgi:pimeloyl-ACP methyl ester carboxylesterase